MNPAGCCLFFPLFVAGVIALWSIAIALHDLVRVARGLANYFYEKERTKQEQSDEEPDA